MFHKIIVIVISCRHLFILCPIQARFLLDLESCISKAKYTHYENCIQGNSVDKDPLLQREFLKENSSAVKNRGKSTRKKD